MGVEPRQQGLVGIAMMGTHLVALGEQCGWPPGTLEYSTYLLAHVGIILRFAGG